MQLIDTHTHLHYHSFDDDRDAVLQRAFAAGVAQLVTLGTDVPSCHQALALADAHPQVFACVGIHPSEAHLAKPDDADIIRELAKSHPKVVAIGEIGLDFYWETEHHAAQYGTFRQMIDIAQAHDFPVVIHNRSAQREMQWFFQEEKIERLNGVMHCFAGDKIDAEFYLDMGLHISFTASITYPSFDENVARIVPLDRTMIETDSPYIAPAKSKKKRNEPANVLAVAQKLAEIHQLPVAEIARITTENARRFFRLPQSIDK